MYIVFNPALSEINHVSIDDPPTLLNFTATLSVSDYQELKRDGGRVQLWSDIPYERAPAPYSEWTSCDFGLNVTNASSLQEIPLSPVDHESSPGTAVLTLQLLVPLSGSDQRRFSYTYRILYPNGEIKWLGEFGQNGTLVCEYTAPEISLGLAAGWTRKEGMYMWSDKSIRTDTPVLKLAKPDEYLALTVGGKNGAFLAFLTARHNKRSVSVPPEYILCASPASVMHVQPEKTITVTGDGPLVLSSVPRRQSDFHRLKSMILEHCSPERVAVTPAGECMLVTERDTLPVEGIMMTTPDLAHTTSLSIQTDTLRSLLPSATPYLLFAPQTFRAYLLTDADTVTFTSPGPFVLSPAFNITSKAHISILSPHKSANLVSTANTLPTPPPTPEWMPRSIIPDPRLHETVSSTPEIVAVQPAEGEINADDSDTQDSKNTNEEIVRSFPRLCLRAVALPARYLLSVALFFLTPVVRLIFGKFTPAEPQENATEAEDVVAIDVQDGASDIANDSDSTHDANHGSAHENAPSRGTIVRPLANDGMPRPAGPCMPKLPGPELEMLKSSPKMLSVEVDEGGTIRLAVWEGETCGVVNAEMNGKRVFVSRMDDSAQALAGTRVEFWELAVDAGGTLRISYDEDKTQAC